MAYGFFNHVDKLKRYGGFSKTEKQWLFASILVMAFLVGFDDGRETFQLVPWLQNMLLGAAAVSLAVLVHEYVKRYWALEAGFRLEFQPFFYGLLAGLIIAFMSYGKLIFLAYSGMRLRTLQAHRLGYFRYHLSYFQQGKIAASGPLANILVAVLFKFLPFVPAAFAEKVVLVNVLFAITNLLPVPPLDGAHLMYASRLVYLWIFGAVLVTGLLLVFSNINLLYVLLAAIVGAILTALLYFRGVEKKLGDW